MKNTLYTVVSFLLLFALASCKYRQPQKLYSYHKKEHAPFDAIIVPGVPFKDSTWQNVMKLRVYWAKYLYDQGMTKNIIFSGGAVYTPYSECEIMRLYALEMGIPDSVIYLDSLAEHSTENVYYGYYVAKDNDLDRLALASDAYQSKGLKGFVRKLNRKLEANVQILPAMTDTLMNMSRPDYDIDFKRAYKTDQFIDITETQGIFYRLGGTMGFHVDWGNRPPVRKRDDTEMTEVPGD